MIFSGLISVLFLTLLVYAAAIRPQLIQGLQSLEGQRGWVTFRNRDILVKVGNCPEAVSYTHLFCGSSSPCAFCDGFNWAWDHFSLWENPDSVRGVKRLVKTRLAEWKGKPAVLSIGMERSDKADGYFRGMSDGSGGSGADVANTVISCIYAMVEAKTMEDVYKRQALRWGIKNQRK